MRGRRLSPLLLALAGLVALSGCSSSSFVGRRFDNFTAYYNKFYNAKKAYREGVKALEERDAPVDGDAYLDVFTVPERAGGGEHFNSAIQKSADVLRKHDASKWADDALLLIGTAYFYERNYVGAEQKFREVIGLDGRFERSPLKDEARFWLARTLIASEDYDEAAAHLEETLRGEGLPRRWEGQMRLALGELHVKRGDWEEAAAELERGLDLVRDDELGARAQFLRAQVLETLGDYEAAAEAFARVRRYDPRFELAYAAEMGALRARGLHGETEGALERLRRMERDDKYYDRRAELATLRARIYQAEGRVGEAERLYLDLLYNGDTDLDLQAVRGRVHYGLGTLYRDAFDDYFLAAAHFDTASTALGSGGRGFGGQDEALAFTSEAVMDGSEQADVFGNFTRVMADVSRMDSLLYLGSLDEAAFEEAILDIRRQRAEELAEEQRLLAERQARQRFSGEDLGEEFDNENFARDPDADEDSAGAQEEAPAAGGTAGFLFHRSPAKVQEGRLLFFDRWGERPLVPNWRRQEAIAGEGSALSYNDRKLQQLQQLGINPQPQLAEAGLPDVDVSDVPRDAERQRLMRDARATARYELANVLFLQVGRPDSAAAWYRTVIEEDAGHAVAQRAYYALAEVQQALGDTASAERIYREMLADYPHSEFAGRIRQRLGLAAETAAAGPDSTKLAEEAYREAFRQWERGMHRRALREMLDVAAHYPRTPVAPKALTAAGSVYAEWARRDSLDPLAPMPLRLPDGLLAQAGLLDAASPDSAGPPDVPVDSLAAGPDVAPVSDSLAADVLVADIGMPGADVRPAPTPEEPASTPLHLETLYASVARNYPQSPYAERARQVLEAIEQLRAPVQASLAIGPGAAWVDSSASAEQALAVAEAPSPQPATTDVQPASREDALLEEKRAIREARQTALVAEQDEDELAALRREGATTPDGRRGQRPDEPRTRVEGAPAAEPLSPEEAASLRTSEGAENGINLGQGGWTLVAVEGAGRAAAEVALQEYGERLGQRSLPVDLLTSEREGSPYYRVVVGRFLSENEAQAALQYLGRELPGTAKLLQLPTGEGPPPVAAERPLTRPERQPETDVAEAEPEQPETDVAEAASGEAISAELRERLRPEGEAPPARTSRGDVGGDVAAPEEARTSEADVREGATPSEEARTSDGDISGRPTPPAETRTSEADAAGMDVGGRPAPPAEARTSADLGDALQRELEELEAQRRRRAAVPSRGIDPAEGGWAIVVASGTDSSQVRAAFAPYATALRLRGLPTDIVAAPVEGGGVRYRALAGQYATRTDAQAALKWLAEALPEDAWLIRVRPEE